MLAIVPILATVGPALLRASDPRPDLSGPTETVTRGGFAVHFTRAGADAPAAVDADHNGLPDLVDVIGLALTDAEPAYLAEGWRPLVGDAGAGGSDLLDVYVRGLSGYGRATPWKAGGEWSCFLEIDPGVQLSGSVARSVATHELHHCVEFRYRADAEPWLYESAATYEQYTHVVDPVLDLAVGFLYTERLGAPERRLGAADGRFEYAGFVWMKFWSELGGFAPGRLPMLWEAIAESGSEGLDTEAERVFDLDLADVYVTHAAWNTFACGGDDGAHYVPDVLPCVMNVTAPVTPWDGTPLDVRHDDGPFTASAFAFDGTGAEVGVTCSGADGLRFAAVSVDVTGGGRELSRGETGDVVVVPSAVDGTVRLVVAGTDLPLDATCEVVDAPARAPRAAGCSTTPSPGWGLLSLVPWLRLRQSRGQARRKPTVSSVGSGR